ncbi:MAG: SdrD B-like domain-containing protein, partial [Halieaceae bacterium]
IIDPADGSIGHLIWQDDNGNGAVDEGEFGLDNITISLLLDADNNGSYETPIGTARSSAGGEYGFFNLAAGNYRVEITDDFNILRGKYLTTPPAPRDITLGAGESLLDADFGYAEIPRPNILTLKIPTQIIHDSPSSDVTYRVAVLNTGNTAVTIDELVDSRFGDLTALPNSTCEANITITQRNIYKCRFTVSVSGAPGELHRNLVSATASDANDNVAFDSGGATIAFRDPDEAAIGDQVWEDLNADGIFDEGEPGVPNVTVELYRAGLLVSSTITDASGNYQFMGLAAGSYEVQITDTAGALGNKVLTTTAEQLSIELALGENYTLADFGYAMAAIEVVKEGDRKVFLEPGGDVTFTVTTRNIGYIDVTLTNLIDDRFGDLNGQGSCATPLRVPARSSVACQFIGNVSGSAGDLHTNTISATATDDAGNGIEGRASFDVDIIGINFGAAGYLVWNDENGNGVRDISEPGIGGVTVDLEVDDDNDGVFDRVAASTVTRQSGFYAFIPVPEGDWRIQVTDDFGVLAGQTLTAGTNPNNFALSGGQLYTEANFGYLALGTGGGPTPPVLPLLPAPGPGTQSVEPEAIPTWPIWMLMLTTMILMGMGVRVESVASR